MIEPTLGHKNKVTKNKVIFICGAGHSGSTLLGMILGSHSHCFYAGEALKTSYFHRDQTPVRKRMCKFCGFDCPVWSKLDLNKSRDIYTQIMAITQKPVVIDSTKRIVWLQQKISEVISNNITPYLIFIQRDGRAVVNSRIRKSPDQDPTEIIRAWVDKIRETEELFTQFPQQKIKVRYEELATKPDSIISHLCNFLELPYESSMRNYYEHEHHPLGGNSGTQSLVLKAQHQEFSSTLISRVETQEDYYKEHPPEIKLDIRWQTELSVEAIALFETIAGGVNQAYQWYD
jgi:LPS sulfotransferase NodH